MSLKGAIKGIIKSIVYGNKSSAEKYIGHLCGLGAAIGNDVVYLCTHENFDR